MLINKSRICSYLPYFFMYAALNRVNELEKIKNYILVMFVLRQCNVISENKGRSAANYQIQVSKTINS